MIMSKITRLRMLNIARVEAMRCKGRKEWHYPANLSVLYEEGDCVKDVLLSHLIAYSYLPKLEPKERTKLRFKIYNWNKKIEDADEDEMLSLLVKLKKTAEDIRPPPEINKLFLFVPMGLEGDNGVIVPDSDIPNYLLGPAPFFSYALNQAAWSGIWFYEILNCIEMKAEHIMMAYERQENTLKKFLGEQHYSVLFPYLLLLNRQGKYIFYEFYCFQYSKEFLVPPTLIKEGKRGNALLISIKDVFAHADHRKWFIKKFIEENELYEAYMNLKYIVGVVELERFGLILKESEAILAYLHGPHNCSLLRSDGLQKL